MRKGTMYAAGAYVLWGLLPLFWHALSGVPAIEILAHRIVWALVVTLLFSAATGRLPALWANLRTRRTLLVFTLSSVLLTANWFIYIWAVNAGFVVETSLGYFINPLVNVVLGMIFLRERLRPGQIAAVGVAFAGVLYLSILYGTPPWIALALAGSFGCYGLLRKIAPIGSLEGLTLETLIVALPALIFLLFIESSGGGAFVRAGLPTTILLAASGIVTAVPLLLFASGARQITMISLGILQYIAPTIQFALGITVFGETVTPQRLIGFALVWLALGLYTLEGMLVGGRRARVAAAGGGHA
ncbi:EamA family transporter RarD [Chloroflexales bacterium ZM16-3]|nr:EamA family transporter RarD [Chloroflexales bacterium ZM16-3]